MILKETLLVLNGSWQTKGSRMVICVWGIVRNRESLWLGYLEAKPDTRIWVQLIHWQEQKSIRKIWEWAIRKGKKWERTSLWENLSLVSYHSPGDGFPGMVAPCHPRALLWRGDDCKLPVAPNLTTERYVDWAHGEVLGRVPTKHPSHLLTSASRNLFKHSFKIVFLFMLWLLRGATPKLECVKFQLGNGLVHWP